MEGYRPESSEMRRNNLYELLEEYKEKISLHQGLLIEITNEFAQEWYEQNKDRVLGLDEALEEQKNYVREISFDRVFDRINAGIRGCDGEIGNPNESQEDKDQARAYKRCLEQIRMKLVSK